MRRCGEQYVYCGRENTLYLNETVRGKSTFRFAGNQKTMPFQTIEDIIGSVNAVDCSCEQDQKCRYGRVPA